MHIDIHDPALEARINKQIQASGGSVEEALNRLLQTQEEQDRWLVENRAAINAKIRRGIEQLDRGEGIPGDEARARLQGRKAALLEENPATKP
jgi:hypothetical protein